ncbi:E3 ubiquitin-protein ligase SIRP1-like isoform X2 [Solanum dulcamara]|nr:E3 ubiquitin-protein ligase SIRP1-like isoform X2 [Solanum dulcamara]XP_055818527.1 E3 ubiquitin-protein ligase SIRP1-like isoform X2 [Solanum dulcamara]XP_055818528.1 E3 ubiquitin-protein ligase SIRP1-like isoform X2 [Solanum dulcamara]XP_055818529.1 E3 ubiquitin-protein ligase SIRP1-like isoform X2 [Solanum dulcamara]XP_055818530.1 E3 ubiquitin-protein ligase SIRP1-like isoform X2 [Solanum dulcamara]XP_055818531.1 E3 ubiquitin-protein ligase SIRP1-like isoform X2 [Solanum dulcamara]XP_05
MDERGASRYWCHHCSRRVNPMMEVELKCPICQLGFIEEMGADSTDRENESPLDSDSDRALSLWAPILLGMMSNPRSRSRLRHLEFEDDDDEYTNERDDHTREADTELDPGLASIMNRRRRNSATILQLLQGIRAGMLSESENADNENRETGRESRDSERVILINPFNQTIIVQGSYDSDNNSRNQPIGSLGDYFIGPGLDVLLQHLAENDPNRYGTPPAQKEVVEALPVVTIDETLQCSVCLEDFEIGTEAKEMPCKHKFHGVCILPWLELHSTCPVCRHQLPSDESKVESAGTNDGSGNTNAQSSNGNGRRYEDEDTRNENGRRFPVSLPWPLSGLFSSSNAGIQSSNGNSSSMTSSSSTLSGNANSNAHMHED